MTDTIETAEEFANTLHHATVFSAVAGKVDTAALIRERDERIRAEERAKTRDVRSQVIHLIAELVRLPASPGRYRDDGEVIDREWVVSIAMRIKAQADRLFESKGGDDG